MFKSKLGHSPPMYNRLGESRMPIGEFLSPISSVSRIILSTILRQRNRPAKLLEASLLMRGIVAELPEDIPYYICDEYGERHKGIYAIGLLIWNKGTDSITSSDFTSRGPLKIELGDDASLVGARAIAAEDETECQVTILDRRTASIEFDCINPNEYLVAPLFVTGNAHTSVKVTGRIVGQGAPLDQTAREVRASIGERITVFIILLMLANTLPGFFLVGGYILRTYGLHALINQSNTIPQYLMASFFLASMIIFLFIFSRTMNWIERRKYPDGYPLHADLEPPLLENIRGMCKTLFKGEKIRISTSMFDWGKPVLMPAKKVRRRTVNDWIA